MRPQFWFLPALAAALLAGCGKSEPPARSTKGGLLSVDSVVVEPRPFKEKLQATGSLLPRESVTLQSEREGMVRSIAFQEGQPVKEGALLLKIDDSELSAQLQRAQARLQLAIADEARQRGLLGRQGISQAAYDESLANLGIARAEVELIKSQLAKTEIRAPFDGIPGLRSVSVGSYVTPGTPIANFAAVDSLKLDFSVPERYLGLLRAGQKVRFRVAGRSEDFEATIYAIEPRIDVATRSVLLRAEVPNPDGKLLPGSFAEILVELDEDPDAILIPSLALIPGLAKQTVFVFEHGVVQERQVSVGIRTADSVQIIDGLQPGDRVITSGILQLRPGMNVQLGKPKTAAPSPDAGTNSTTAGS
jgi:RND family efflux transporter, MFP subunit